MIWDRRLCYNSFAKTGQYSGDVAGASRMRVSHTRNDTFAITIRWRNSNDPSMVTCHQVSRFNFVLLVLKIIDGEPDSFDRTPGFQGWFSRPCTINNRSIQFHCGGSIALCGCSLRRDFGLGNDAVSMEFVAHRGAPAAARGV